MILYCIYEHLICYAVAYTCRAFFLFLLLLQTQLVPHLSLHLSLHQSQSCSQSVAQSYIPSGCSAGTHTHLIAPSPMGHSTQ